MPSEDTKLNRFVINLKSSLEGIEDIPLDEMILVEDNTEYATVEDLATKQNVINDLTTIRSNASIGAGLAPQVATNTQRIEDLTVAKQDKLTAGTNINIDEETNTISVTGDLGAEIIIREW